MILWTLTNLAFADCPPPDVQVERAWNAFNDAELDEAKQILQQATEDLSCQTTVVPTEQLLALYRLDALVSVSQEDQQGAVYATINAVTLDPTATPPDDMGPALADLFKTWASRLGDQRVEARVIDEGTAWIDGREVTASTPISLVEGQHLVQFQSPTGWISERRELHETQQIITGNGTPVPVEPSPIADPDPTEATPSPKPARRRPVGLLGTGLGVAAIGGGAIGYGFWAQQRFRNDDFLADSYGSCGRNDSCYADARAETIQNSANQIRFAYGTGYGLVGVGAVMSLTALIGLPVSTDGATVRVHVRW